MDLGTGELSELEYRLLQWSALGSWFPGYVEGLWRSALRSRTDASLDRLVTVSREPIQAPRAVYVHIPLPHRPNVVDKSCSPVATSPFTFEGGDPGRPEVLQAMRESAEQTQCVDGLLARTLTLVVQADPEAVVVLISDHGPDSRFDPANPSQPGLGDRIACLFAARTPGFSQLFPDDVSLVNVLPRLFNAYFAMSLPLHSGDIYARNPGAGGALARVQNP